MRHYIPRTLTVLSLTALLCVAAAWRYQDLPMRECAWCHTPGTLLNGLNRCHIVPQSVDPGRRDCETNLVVLCRECHYVLSHRRNWRTWNPDLLVMVRTYTNCLPCEKGD